jgi:TonB family protein
MPHASPGAAAGAGAVEGPKANTLVPQLRDATPEEQAQPTGTPKRIRLGGQMEQAKWIFHPNPEYPPLAKTARIQGTVRLEAIISKDGTVQDLKVISGHPLLVQSALDTVAQWKYQPTLLNGEPVEVLTEIDVNFTLSEGPGRGQPGAEGSAPPVTQGPAQEQPTRDTAAAEQGQPEQALAEAYEARPLDAVNADPHSNLSDELRRKGDLEGALLEARQTAQLKPNDAVAHRALGSALRAKGDVDGAITEYRKALSLNPDYAQAHEGLGNALQQKHDLNGAILEYLEALRLKPDGASAHQGLGHALRAKGDLDKAIVQFRAAMQLAPDNPNAHHSLGLALYDQRNFSEAVSEFRDAVTLDPKHRWVWNNLGRAYLALGQLDSAVDAFDKQIEVNPRDQYAYNNLGLALWRQGKSDGAITAFRKQIEISPDDRYAHANLGRLYAEREQYSDAVVELEKAIVITPNNAIILASLSRAYLKLGQAEKSKSLDEKLVSQNAPSAFSAEGPVILSDIQGVDFGPYLARAVLIVRRNWYALIPEVARQGQPGRVSVSFEISKDGSVPRMQVTQGSGDDSLDKAALAAIQSTVPFPPLPQEFAGNHLALQLTFLYNQGTRSNGTKFVDDAQPEGGLFSVGGGVSAPTCIYCPDPPYSDEARKAKLSGTVVVQVVVDATGNVRDAKVVQPLGLGLDEKATETIRTWRFKPAMRNGSPVNVRMLVKVDFRLLFKAPSSFETAPPQQQSGPARSPLGQSRVPASTATPVPPQASPMPAEPAAAPDLLDEANNFYRKGDFDRAIQKYQQLLQTRPNSPDAYAGLTRVYLKKKDVQQAFDTVTRGLQSADSPVLRVALGEVYFRQGRIPKAEQEWLNVISSGQGNAGAYLGLARVRWAICMNKSGRDMIDKAHELDSSDPGITMLWAGRLTRAERIKYYEQYLASDTNDDAETRAAIQHQVDYLKARAKDPRAGCHLVTQATTTETKLVRLLTDPTHLRGYGLWVAVNGQKSALLLDTGASGITINRNLAEKAGVTKLSETDIGGIGDRGSRSGYMGLANSLKIGELEFQDCPVQVFEQRSVTGEDGLIGADVFAAFLVDIDFPNEKLHLRELPKRPGETGTKIALQSESSNASSFEEEPEEKTTEPSHVESAPAPHAGPQDRYIAPDMKSYTQVCRFGHQLLVPTSVGEAPVKLFLLDTGTGRNFISLNAAEEVTKVHADPRSIVKGINGSVKSVYRADKAVIQFGRLRQENQDLVAIDLSHVSDRTGTEVSGILGFAMLRLLDIKIDYRDALVDFSYDPKRWSH